MNTKSKAPNTKSPKPDWETFGQRIMEYWPESDIDGFELQELAINHNIIVEVPGGFDPKVHEDTFGFGADPGEPWFERNYKEA